MTQCLRTDAEILLSLSLLLFTSLLKGRVCCFYWHWRNIWISKKNQTKRFKVMLAVHEFCMLLLFKMFLIARLYHLTCHRERWTISPYRLKIPTTQTKLFNLRMHSAYIMFDYIYMNFSFMNRNWWNKFQFSVLK